MRPTEETDMGLMDLQGSNLALGLCWVQVGQLSATCPPLSALGNTTYPLRNTSNISWVTFLDLLCEYTCIDHVPALLTWFFEYVYIPPNTVLKGRHILLIFSILMLLNIVSLSSGYSISISSIKMSVNVNWCSHCGEQYGGSLKTKNRTTIWFSILDAISRENHILKIHAPNVHCSTVYNSQDMEAT